MVKRGGPMAALNEKQKMFCVEYLIDYNGTQAAIRAGYAKKSARAIASENLTKPDIIEYLNELTREKADKAKLSAQFVLDGFIAIYDRCMQGVEVTDKDGNGIGVWQFNSAGANTALRSLGQHLQLFTEKKIVDVNVSGSLEHEVDMHPDVKAIFDKVLEHNLTGKQHRPGEKK